MYYSCVYCCHNITHTHYYTHTHTHTHTTKQIVSKFYSEHYSAWANLLPCMYVHEGVLTSQLTFSRRVASTRRSLVRASQPTSQHVCINTVKCVVNPPMVKCPRYVE